MSDVGRANAALKAKEAPLLPPRKRLDGDALVKRMLAEGRRGSFDRGPESVLVGRFDLAEDLHDGQFGLRCEQCHVTANWKTLQNRMNQSSLRAPQAVALSLPELGWSSYVNRHLGRTVNGESSL